MKTHLEIIRTIRTAFIDTVISGGIGLHEATALDNRADKATVRLARERDTEDHWWDVAEQWDGQLGTALSFADKNGFVFLLPATMTSARLGSSFNASSVRSHLCVIRKPYIRAPHHGHPEYTDYLRSLHAKEWINYFGFTNDQTHAIALFLEWVDRGSDSLIGFSDHPLESLKRSHESSLAHARTGDYTLSWQDVINNYDEEQRILREWLEAGTVSS